MFHINIGGLFLHKNLCKINTNLMKLEQNLDVNLENAHRATNDAVATAEVMIKLLKKN